jgi:hypothetical protein
MADAFGCVGLRAEKPSELDGKIREMLDVRRPVLFDVRDIIETLEDVPIASIGTRLSLVSDFRHIVSVRTALNADGGTAAYVKVLDKDAELGPLVRAFDSDDAATTAVVDAVVHGY